MILEALKNNPQISCLQCSLMKLSTTNLVVGHVSEVRHVWETVLEPASD